MYSAEQNVETDYFVNKIFKSTNYINKPYIYYTFIQTRPLFSSIMSTRFYFFRVPKVTGSSSQNENNFVKGDNDFSSNKRIDFGPRVVFTHTANQLNSISPFYML